MMAALKQQLESNAKFLAVLEQIRQELQQRDNSLCLEYEKNEELGLHYLSGKFVDNEDCEIFIPVTNGTVISAGKMANIQRSLCHGNRASRLTLVFIDDSSTSTYYRVTPGFVCPAPPE